MADYISRQAALNLLTKWADGYNYIEVETQSAINEFERLPSADAQPVRHGHWIYTPTNLLGYVCSECGNGMCRFNYCPHCGALMDEVT